MEILKDQKVIMLISSLVAVFSAVVSIINTRITVRNAGKSNQDLELLKFELEKKKSFSKIPEGHIVQRLQAIDEFIGQIQRIKDNLTIIIQAAPNSMSAQSAITLINNARTDFFTVYQKSSAHLEAAENKAAHDSKNLALRIEGLVEMNWGETKFINLKPEDVIVFTDLKNQLSDHQNLLRDSKLKVIYNY